MVLLDGLWFFGGNRGRGVGRYLTYYLDHVLAVPAHERIWLVPRSAPDTLRNELVTRFGGHSLVIDFSETMPRQLEVLRRYLNEKEVLQAQILSPFERPWSMLDFLDVFVQLKIETQSIVFDVLPLQFPKQILEKWPEQDQKMYQRRIQKLPQVNKILAISPFTQQQLTAQLGLPANVIDVLDFGLNERWIVPPKEVDLKWWREMSCGKYVVTISGGEWRKNLEGTISYFAKKYAKKGYTLLVICKLGRKEKFRFQFLAWRLGIYHTVQFLGQIDERIKWRFLAQAKVFLFLSRGEGLGLPVFEAKRAGIPEIVISQELADAGLSKLIKQVKVVRM